MKKIIVALFSLLFIPLLANASIDSDLYYGLKNNDAVLELQEFLISKGFLEHEPTGSFLSLTLNAVKAYQTSIGIQSTGYVGTLTRQAINNDLKANLSASNNELIAETGTITPVQTSPQKTNNDIVKSLQEQIALLLQQVSLLQTQQTTTQQLQQTVQQQSQAIQQQQTALTQIQQNTQQIAQNTTVQTLSASEAKAADIGRQINSYLQNLESQITAQRYKISALESQTKSSKSTSGCTKTSNGCISSHTNISYDVGSQIESQILVQLLAKKDTLNSIYKSVQNYGISGVLPSSEDISFLSSIGIPW